MNLSDIDAQQEQTKLRLSSGPVGWRRQDHKGRWHLVDSASLEDWQMRDYGCEPVFGERKAMSDAAAAKLAKQHKGSALVRAVEQWHFIN